MTRVTLCFAHPTVWADRTVEQVTLDVNDVRFEGGFVVLWIARRSGVGEKSVTAVSGAILKWVEVEEPE